MNGLTKGQAERARTLLVAWGGKSAGNKKRREDYQLDFPASADRVEKAAGTALELLSTVFSLSGDAVLEYFTRSPAQAAQTSGTQAGIRVLKPNLLVRILAFLFGPLLIPSKASRAKKPVPVSRGNNGKRSYTLAWALLAFGLVCTIAGGIAFWQIRGMNWIVVPGKVIAMQESPCWIYV